MTLECTPFIARSVARHFAQEAATVGSASASLSSTAAANGTTDLTIGLPLLSSECVEEIGLIASVLENLASAVEHADIFSGAGIYFTGAANDALKLLLGSLSDGVGDFGGGTPEMRRDRIINELWPDGVPPGISDAELVDHVMNHPRALTLTPTELAEVWPTLPAAGREDFAEDHPVVVLDLVIDGGLQLTDGELDIVTESILHNPPTVPIPSDQDLLDQLDAAGEVWFGFPSLNRVGVALDRADILIAAGEAGAAYRDAVNHPMTYVAVVVGLQAGGAASRTDDGLIVIVVPEGGRVDTGLFTGTDLFGEVQPYGKGGTTFGNTFIGPERGVNGPKPDLLRHETVHTYQWAGAGLLEYPALYIAESAKSAVVDVLDTVDVDVDVDVDINTVGVDLGPIGPSSTPKFNVPGPSWIPDVPSIPLPRLDPPKIVIPVGIDVDVDVDASITLPAEMPDTGCDNRFEQHADLGDGGYGCVTDTVTFGIGIGG